MSQLPTRDEAVALMHEYTANENLRRHMYGVEICMRAYADKYGEDAEVWGQTGLLHDFDYERWPNDDHLPDAEHPSAGVAILRERGYPEEMLHAIMAHADYTNTAAESKLDITLRAVDELSGFVIACTLVRPNGIMDLAPKSVKKKLKDKAFAAAVDREGIREAQETLGEDPTEHIQFVIDALRSEADALGL